MILYRRAIILRRREHRRSDRRCVLLERDFDQSLRSYFMSIQRAPGPFDGSAIFARERNIRLTDLLSSLPAVNAVLNSISAVLIVIGIVQVKRKQFDAHRRVIALGAVVTPASSSSRT